MSDQPPVLFQLFPQTGQIPSPLTTVQLSALYAYPDLKGADQVYLRANMVSTIDGAATGSNGLSGTINNEPDFRIFQILRALAQVVIVGATTARKEGYRNIGAPAKHENLRVASGITQPLEFAILTRSGHLPPSALDHKLGHPAPLIFTTSQGNQRLISEHENPRVIVAETDGAVDLAKILSTLGNLGLRRVLTEGGPSVLAQFIDQSLLNELCLTTVNLVQPGQTLGITTNLDIGPGAHASTLASLLLSDSTLLARWLL